jgi:excisionase family DNA binding protein
MDDDRLTLDVATAGRLLGLSRPSAYKAAHGKLIPTIRIGRRLLVPKVQLERLLNGVNDGRNDTRTTQS